eukprot:Em0606g3a
MLGLTNIDKNEAIVVRTTMASQQLGISPDAMLREIAYSHSRCFGKGERKFRFKVEGGYQQANCLGVYLCCLPATLKQELKTLLEVPAPAQGPPDVEDVAQNPLQPVPAQFPQGSPDVEHVAQNPAPAQLSALAFFDDVDVRRDVEAGDIARNPLQPAPPVQNDESPQAHGLEAAAMHSLPSVGLATSTPIRGPHAGSAPYAAPSTYTTACWVFTAVMGSQEQVQSMIVVQAAKQQFARHGIPVWVHSDGGSQFAAREFSVFSHAWGFEHTLSSPYNSQSNGKAESEVKIAKKLWKRSKYPYLALLLLEWRNTPTVGMGSSPCQRLLARRTRGVVPMAEYKREPVIEPHVLELEKKLKKQGTEGANQRVPQERTLPSLAIGQPMLAQDMRAFKTQWDRGTCVGRLSNRSYIVDIDDQLVRRNRKFLKPSVNKRQYLFTIHLAQLMATTETVYSVSLVSPVKVWVYSDDPLSGMTTGLLLSLILTL